MYAQKSYCAERVLKFVMNLKICLLPFYFVGTVVFSIKKTSKATLCLYTCYFKVIGSYDFFGLNL